MLRLGGGRANGQNWDVVLLSGFSYRGAQQHFEATECLFSSHYQSLERPVLPQVLGLVSVIETQLTHVQGLILMPIWTPNGVSFAAANISLNLKAHGQHEVS